MPNPQQTCGNCRFLDDTHEDGYPRCHRYPPQAQDETTFGDPPIRLKIELHVWGFPEVHKDDWCGEWQPIAESGDSSE